MLPTKTELQAILKTEARVITFTKVNGDSRIMKCTLQPDMLPKLVLTEGKTPKKQNDKVIAVWDLEKEGWRSITVDTIIYVDKY